MSDLIVRNIQHSKINVLLESGDLSQRIVGNVEFFKVGKGGEARYSR